MQDDSQPPTQSMLDYARPGIEKPKPAPDDLERAFGCFPALGSMVCGIASWVFLGVSRFGSAEPYRLTEAAAFSLSVFGIIAAVVVLRRSIGGWLGAILLLMSGSSFCMTLSDLFR